MHWCSDQSPHLHTSIAPKVKHVLFNPGERGVLDNRIQTKQFGERKEKYPNNPSPIYVHRVPSSIHRSNVMWPVWEKYHKVINFPSFAWERAQHLHLKYWGRDSQEGCKSGYWLPDSRSPDPRWLHAELGIVIDWRRRCRICNTVSGEWCPYLWLKGHGVRLALPFCQICLDVVGRRNPPNGYPSARRCVLSVRRYNMPSFPKLAALLHMT